MIFQNENCSYPICGVPHYAPDVRAAMDNIRTHVRFLQENSTHLTQPCDTFIISKIKDAWTRMLEQHKIQMIMENDWQRNDEFRTSGLLKNPGKTFFLQVAAAAVREVNQQVTKQIDVPGVKICTIDHICKKSFDYVWTFT
ncbi:hypothetical protein R1sor_001663 [Riccia sorocarpa]|uniref:Uncharacterized protein n=1 Tax=Riccia sorocarpa TaxID=122646 RepID=A0ABD3GYJ3_9MARC